MTKAHKLVSGPNTDSVLPGCEVSNSQLVKNALAEHQGSLVRYAQHFVGDLEGAKDVVQDTFLKLCGLVNGHQNSTAGSHVNQPLLDDQSHLKRWLYRVCRNRAIDVCRKENRMKVANFDQLEGIVSEQARPAEVAQRDELNRSVMDQVEQLTDNQQEVLRLKFQAGLSYKEIAEVTGLTSTNVGFVLHTAIKQLRNRLADA